MKFLCMTSVLMPCFLTAISAFSSDATHHADLISTLASLPGINVASNEAFGANYPNTHCVDLSTAKTDDKIGLVCRSGSPEFIKDMGITEFDTLPESARLARRPASGLVIATPMAQYDMGLMPDINGRVAEAMVDCDAGAGAIYRATATCHVAITTPFGDEVTYSNIVVRRHTEDRPELSRDRILEIWRRLERR